LRNKFCEIKFLLENKSAVNVLIIGESKIDENDDSSLFEIPGYKFYRNDRTGRGGGVAMYVKNNITIIEENIDKDLEMILVKLKFPNNYVLSVFGVYRSPSNPSIEKENFFFEQLEIKITEQCSKTDNIIIAGDINYNMFEENNPLKDFCNEMDFTNTITSGTRSHYSRTDPKTLIYTLLDVILVLCSKIFITSKVFDCQFLTDHNLTISIFNIKTPNSIQQTFSSRCLNKGKLNKIKEDLKSTSFILIDKINNVHERWLAIENLIKESMNKFAPEKKMTIRTKNSVPWFDKELNSLSKKRTYFYNKAIKSRNSDSEKQSDQHLYYWSRFCDTKKRFSTAFRKKKCLYYNNVINDKKMTPFKLWNFLNPMLNPNKKSSNTPIIIHENNTYNEPKSLTSLFTEYFTTTITSLIILPIDNCIRYINIHFLYKVFHYKCFDFYFIHDFKVVEYLKKLKTKSSPGIIGIPTIIFSTCSEELSKPLASLFNLCIAKGEIPDSWKTSVVTPIYKKKGSKSDLSSYRPIAVSPPISKVFENILAGKIYYHFESNKMFSDSQYGFRKERSCEHALNDILENIRQGLDDDKISMAVLIDFRKAFDTVDHKLLIEKLRMYFFSPSAIKLMSNYLENRTFITKIGKSSSKPAPLNIGVPQGSVLGPLLFNIFINDMNFLDFKSKATLFADDTTLHIVGDSIENVCKDLQSDLILLLTWLHHNRLFINWDKTIAILFRKKTSKFKDVPKITVENNNIQFVEKSKLLGVTIDSNLDFHEHVSNTCKKANSKIFTIKRSLHLLPHNFRPTAFKLFIMPHFDYCSTLYFITNKLNESKLIKCYNKAIKVILNLNINEHIYNIEAQYNLLKLFNIYPLTIRKFIHLSNFIFNLFKNNNCTSLISYFNQNTTIQLREKFHHTPFNSNYQKYSFTSLGTNLLNKFIYNYVTADYSKCMFENMLIKNDLIMYKNCKLFFDSEYR